MSEGLDEVVPGVGDLVMFELSATLVARLEIGPPGLIEADEISVREGERVLAVVIQVGEVEGEQVLLAGRVNSPRPYESLLRDQVTEEVRHRVHGRHDDVERRIVQHVDERAVRIQITDDERLRVRSEPPHVGAEHQAPRSAVDPLAGMRDSVDRDDEVIAGTVGRRHRDRQRLRTGRVEEHSVWMVPDPTLGSPRLFRASLHGSAQPALPDDVGRTLELEQAVLVREDDDVVAHHDEEVTDLLVATLVAERARVAPERKEVPVAQSLEVPLGLGDAAGLRDRSVRLVRHGR